MQNIFTIQFPEGGGNSKCQTAHGDGWWETAVEQRDPGGCFWERTQPSGSDLKLTRNMFTEKQLVLRNFKMDRKLRRAYVDRFWLRSPIFTGWISSSTSKALHCGMWLLLLLPVSPMWTHGDVSLNRGDVVLHETPKLVLCCYLYGDHEPFSLLDRWPACTDNRDGTGLKLARRPPESLPSSEDAQCTREPSRVTCFNSRLDLTW